MKITVIDTKTGKARVMERRFAQILSKMGKVRPPAPVKPAPKAEEPPKRKPKAEEPVADPVKAEEPVKAPEPKKREYKRRDLKAEE